MGARRSTAATASPPCHRTWLRSDAPCQTGLVKPAGPSRADVEGQFVRLLSGEASRDEIDRWAGRFVTGDFDVTDEGVWTALDRLFGVDLRHGAGLPYLHTDEQIAEWLADFRVSGQPGTPA
jgi:hypothetical protein